MATVNEGPSSAKSDLNIKEGHSVNLQYVQRFKIGEKTGSIRALGFYNKSFSGKYSDFVFDTVSAETSVPDSLKAYNAKIGFALDADFAFNDNFGMFAKFSWNDGKTEAMHFTEADQSLALGLVYNLGKFKRPNDKFGIAASINSLSKDHQEYLANGGSGFMLGDGSLNYNKEMAFEFFYNINLFKYATVGLNYQYIVNAGYNVDKGNASFFGCRLNFSF